MKEIHEPIESAEKSLSEIKLKPGPQHLALLALIAAMRAIVARLAAIEAATPAPAPAPEQSA